MRIAIVGTGISGLTAAHLLSPRHDVTVFEKEPRPGGHTHTVRVDLADETHHVDTGFIVYNTRNYPGLVRLFERLGVAWKPSDMSFSVSDERVGLEWCGSSPGAVFAQRRNLVRPAFMRMLADVVRFNRALRHLARSPAGTRPDGLTLAGLVAERGWSRPFADWYLVPMTAAIWSADPTSVLEMPALTAARFFDQHGLLDLGGRPAWRTVEGGAARYVDAVLGPLGRRVRLATPVDKIRRRPDGVEVVSAGAGPERFDHVILATHSDQALALLSDPTPDERRVLGSVRYQRNHAVLHTDHRLLPRRRRAWASWNAHVGVAGGERRATLTYHLNRLQGITSSAELCLTLNRSDAVDPDRVLATMDYEHPVLDGAAVAAQAAHDRISGRDGTWFCGAYWGFGFHEDGVESARRVCRRFGVDL